MTGNEFKRTQITLEQSRGSSGAILVIDAVKAVFANAFLVPTVWPGINCRRQGNCTMKSRVKHRNLWNRTQKLLNDLHAFEFGAIMQRREGFDFANGLFDRTRDNCRLP